MTNALAQETSPYLLQHKDNPVDWMPWSTEAWARARAEDKPVLVSIGYAACHWCHVMEHESFEDPAVAALMNEKFVCLKVDREERPDVDAIYMEAVQAMTGQGGWPLNAFCTPEQVPFWAGTYFPPRPGRGMPSWPQVLAAIAQTWEEKREEIRSGAGRIVDHLGATGRLAPAPGPAPAGLLDAAVAALRGRHDPEGGGWGSAPKFPQPSLIDFLLGRGETEVALGTLSAMARGGLFDQVGGGFARYSVDRTWTVPHFEKMLYDNAGLARAYLHGWLVSGDARLREVCGMTLDWALREMRGPEGGFASSLDADSEGEEGRFYVWSAAELGAVLGEDAPGAVAWFGVTERGNFEGENVLRADGARPARADPIRAALLVARAKRVRPGQDDKRVTSWNAMMLAALAEAGAVLEREDYLVAAVACGEFLLRDLRDPATGRLFRTWKDGRAKLGGYLEDHAYALDALLTLYEATAEPRWFTAARELADVLLEHFHDPAHGGFFTTPDDHEELIARRKDLEDSPIPSGNSAAALGLLRLAAFTGEDRYRAAGDGVVALLHPLAERHPLAFGHLLRAIAFAAGPVREVALVGADTTELARVVRGRFRPEVVLAAGSQGTAGEAGGLRVPLLRDRPAVDGRATAYVCEGFVCRAPVTDPAALAAALDPTP